MATHVPLWKLTAVLCVPLGKPGVRSVPAAAVWSLSPRKAGKASGTCWCSYSNLKEGKKVLIEVPSWSSVQVTSVVVRRSQVQDRMHSKYRWSKGISYLRVRYTLNLQVLHSETLKKKNYFPNMDLNLLLFKALLMQGIFSECNL